MLTLLNRIAWGLSLIIAFFLAYLVSDIFSSSYDNGAENLFSWGWMF